VAEYLAEFFHDLPEGLLDWVASMGPGIISRLERHVARREAWVVDVRRADGSVMKSFLRIDRNPHQSSSLGNKRGLLPIPITIPQIGRVKSLKTVPINYNRLALR